MLQILLFMTFYTRLPLLKVAANLLILTISCAEPNASAEDNKSLLSPAVSPQDQGEECPKERTHSGLPPQTDEVHHDLDYWIETWAGQFDIDEPLLSLREVESHRAALALELPPEGVEGELRAQIDLGAPVEPSILQKKIRGRLNYLQGLIDSGHLTRWSGDPLSAEELEAFKESAHQLVTPSVHVALEEIQVRCGPYPLRLKRLNADLTIDRNACTRIKPQAPLQLLARSPQGMHLVRSRLALGWISAESKISAELTQHQALDYLNHQFFYQPRRGTPAEIKFKALSRRLNFALSPLGSTRFPLVSERFRQADEPEPEASAWVATTDEIRAIPLRELHEDEGSMLTSDRPFSRRELLRELFNMLDQPYGLGGSGEGVDCSRMIVNAFEPFGINPPRYSGHQANMGTFGIDISSVKDDQERLNLLNAAHKRGVALLYLPGHITVYLGTDQEGIPRLFHAFADYQEQCSSGNGETTLRVNRVAVTDVYRGQGSTKGSYLQRGTRIVVLGGSPGAALDGVAQLRRAAPITPPKRAECKRTKNRARVFTSPVQPHQGQETRLMVTRPKYDGPATLTLFGPNGETVTPPLSRLGGPPYTYYTAPLSLKRGSWRVAYGEAEDLHACTHIEVSKRPRRPHMSEAMWTPEAEWSAHTETLFSAFVERLFQYPIEEDRSWTNLQDLLKVKEQNLLYDHFSTGEDGVLKLQPDCADLPYTLRAYFAWKMRLPFSYMSCTRGSRKKAPRCMNREDSFMPRDNRKLGNDFQWFARKGVAGHVHSASARTLPNDDKTELYPVALTREALRPGTVFADPYGHILLIASWVRQPLGGYGVLIGADGQPDGTIGRRRFWEGSFLFDPDTRLVGAGFKAFRPLVLDRDKVKSRLKQKNSTNIQSNKAPTRTDQRAGLSRERRR